MIAAILIVVAVATLGLMYVVPWGGGKISRLDDLAGKTRRVDLEAFRNLVDPAEEEFLRSRLPPREFRAVQRERLRATADYLSCAAHNASVLFRLGQAARLHPDAKVAETGLQLVTSALRFRMYYLPVLARLYVGVAFPQWHLSAERMPESYQDLSGMASRLAVMQNPARAARVAAIL